MQGETHLIGGWVAALAIDQWVTHVATRSDVVYIGRIPVSEGLIAAAVVGFAALLPDIDEPHSMVANLPKYSERVIPLRSRDVVSRALREIVRAIAAFLNLLAQGLSGLIRVIAGGHRGATHWLLTGAVLTWLAWLAGRALYRPEVGLWFAIGYASHLVLDMWTTRGLRVLRPFTKHRLHLLPKPLLVSTGSRAEDGLRAWFIVFIVLLLFT